MQVDGSKVFEAFDKVENLDNTASDFFGRKSFDVDWLSFEIMSVLSIVFMSKLNFVSPF